MRFVYRKIHLRWADVSKEALALMEDSIYRLRYRDLLALCVFALLALGIIMVQSAAAGVTGKVGWQWTQTGTRDAIYVLLAAITFLVVGHLDYRILTRPFFFRKNKNLAPAVDPAPSSSGLLSIPQVAPGQSPLRALLHNPVVWIYLLGVFTCLVVLVPGIGTSINGARRWLKFGPVTLQASEAGKWACVIFYAWLLSFRVISLRSFWGFAFCLAPLAVVCLLVVKEDFGTSALIGMCIIAMMIAARARIWHLAVLFPPLMAAAYWFVRHKDYRWRRVIAFIDPYAAPQEEGYHLIQSLLCFASGGIMGKGLGNGVQKLGYLPEDTTDFIFAIICEELGLFGALLTIALYLGVVWSCWQIIRQSRDSFGRLIAFGVGSMIGIQAMLNIAVATVSVPPKGLPLPLVSFGGSGLVITSVALGLVYSVARVAEKEQPQEDKLPLAAALAT